MRINEILSESRSAPLYKGATLDQAEQILASNAMLGTGWLGNEPIKSPDGRPAKKDETWAWRRRGLERYMDRSPDIPLYPWSTDDEVEQFHKVMEPYRKQRAKKFPNKRYPSMRGAVSLTRDKNIARGWAFGRGVIFVLNQELLWRDLGKRIHPYHDWGSDEAEESVFGGIPNIKKYITRIELVGSGFDPEKYPNLAQYIQQ